MAGRLLRFKLSMIGWKKNAKNFRAYAMTSWMAKKKLLNFRIIRIRFFMKLRIIKLQ